MLAALPSPARAGGSSAPTPRCSPRRRPLILVLGLLVAAPASAQKFRPDDPVWSDPDHLTIEQPAVVELSTAYDVLEHTFSHRPDGPIPPAHNVNSLGEVPDSSWFTNRMGRRTPPLDELLRGPDTVDGPNTSAPWTVIRAKTQGITPGFTIRDARGDVYFVKFDPIEWPNLSTAADVVSTKFFHAFGYNVPENYVVHFRPEALRIAPEASVTRAAGRRGQMTQADLDAILERTGRRPDGSVRALASRALPGQPVGPRKFHGVRGDDPNDLFPHEHRRDLRGLRVFCAWLNHDDSRSINSLDVYVSEAGRRFLKHYLIDFSSTLGSGSDERRQVAPQNPRAGNEYVLELAPALKTAVTLGLWERPWKKVAYRLYPEIGRIEGDFFEPQAWKPEYPNPAFERMLPQDAFWATRIVARFSEAAVRALVGLGRYDDAEAERHLGDVLLQRRDKILGFYLRQLSPLDEFRVEERASPQLAFEHLGVRLGLGQVEGYDFQWFVFDNASGRSTPLGAPGETPTASLPIPASEAPFLRVRITARADEAGWRLPVDAYLRLRDARRELVGLEREGLDWER